MSRSRCFGWAVLLSCVLFHVGCVQAQANSQRPEAARLMISRGANGVNMQWMGKEDTVYTLYYRDTVGTDTAWKPVPGYQNVEGRGEMIEFQDTAPTAKTRRYRVHTVKTPQQRG